MSAALAAGDFLEVKIVTPGLGNSPDWVAPPSHTDDQFEVRNFVSASIRWDRNEAMEEPSSKAQRLALIRERHAARQLDMDGLGDEDGTELDEMSGHGHDSPVERSRNARIE